MVNQNELRIGNLVFDDPKLRTLHRIEWHNLGLKKVPYDPIPLTPEILKKCGFDKYGEWIILKTYPLDINISFVHNKTTIGCNEEYKIENMNFLHQLQNLYFVLTSEELKVNL